MARVVQRRFLAPAEAKARRPVGPAQRLGPVGWVFAVLAVGWAVVALRPLTEFSAFDSVDKDALLIVQTLGDVAILALPAGLLLGFPGARRRNPWLFRGVVLIALVSLVQPALRALQTWVLDQVDLSAGGFSPLYAATAMVSLAIGIVSLAAVWAVSDGLFDAGARPRRLVLALVAAAAVVLELVFVVPLVVDNGLAIFRNGILDIASFAISVAFYAAWYVVAARLVVGFTLGLVPRRAWAVGAFAGALYIIGSLATTLQVWAGQFWGALLNFGIALQVASSAVWVLLLVALALGLGRGTSRGAGERRRLPRYQLGRPAAAGSAAGSAA